MRQILQIIFLGLFLVALPFFVLIRGAVFYYEHYQVWPWIAILLAIITSASLWLLYILYFQGRLLGKIRGVKQSYMLTCSLVLVYCLPCLFSISAANSKSKAVKDEFTTLHPILRLSIGTILWLDQDLILTDASRLPEDYKKMGLKRKSHSLHYIQSSGYSHAVDIRTKGRSAFRNQLIQFYFRSMGFNTLRHVGTADHLHVSISSKDRVGGI